MPFLPLTLDKQGLHDHINGFAFNTLLIIILAVVHIGFGFIKNLIEAVLPVFLDAVTPGDINQLIFFLVHKIVDSQTVQPFQVMADLGFRLARDEDGKIIAANPGEDIAIADPGADALGNLD